MLVEVGRHFDGICHTLSGRGPSLAKFGPHVGNIVGRNFLDVRRVRSHIRPKPAQICGRNRPDVGQTQTNFDRVWQSWAHMGQTGPIGGRRSTTSGELGPTSTGGGPISADQVRGGIGQISAMSTDLGKTAGESELHQQRKCAGFVPERIRSCATSRDGSPTRLRFDVLREPTNTCGDRPIYSRLDLDSGFSTPDATNLTIART